MKRRVISILLIVTIMMNMLLALTGCGDDDNSDFSSKSKKEETNVEINEVDRVDEVNEKEDDIKETNSEATYTENFREAGDESLVGHYADIDGDGTVDGIIYADLLADGGKSGTWFSELDSQPDRDDMLSTTYTLLTINAKNVKTYKETTEEYEESGFGKSTIIVVDPSSKGTLDRFYVMSLSDITDGENSKFYWYNDAFYQGMDDYASTTKTDFGEGKTNTANVMKKWNKEDYGVQDDRDLWKVIKKQVNKGWFVPSNDEWAAFGNAFKINSDNYEEFGLDGMYWSSTQSDIEKYVCTAFFYGGYMYEVSTNNENSVRLSATF